MSSIRFGLLLESGGTPPLLPGFLSGTGVLYGPTLSGGSIVVPAPFLIGTAVFHAPVLGPRLYAARDGSWNGSPATSDLYVIDLATGQPISVGPIGYAIEDMAFDPTTGILYAVTSPYSGVSPLHLIKIDIFTGAGTDIGPLSPLTGFQALAGITFSQTGTLYGYGGVGGGNLYTVNKTTGAVTLLQTPTFFARSGVAIAMDKTNNIYVTDQDFDGSELWLAMVNGTVIDHADFLMQFSKILNGDEVLVTSGDSLDSISFGPDGTAYVVDLFDDTIMTLQPDGTLAVVGVEGSLDPAHTDNVHDFAALAWLGGNPPNRWFTFPDFYEDFENAPMLPTPFAYSSPTPPVISTDGYVDGSHSFKVDSPNDDQYVEYLLPTSDLEGYGWPLKWQPIYFSFALYVPDASDINDYAYLFSWGQDIFIFSNGDGTAKLRAQFNADEFFSPNFTAGAWHSFQIYFVADNGSGEWAIQFWVDGVTNGLQTATSGTGSVGGDIDIGDFSHGGDGTDLLYYLDALTWSMVSMPAAPDVSGAVFNGVGSGADIDASTGTPISGHPVDDNYQQLVNHTLTVPGPVYTDSPSVGGSPIFYYTETRTVMDNDALATTVSLATPPTHGTLTYFNPDGTFQYVPDTDFVGTDSFTYNGNGGTATVFIRIFDVTAAAFDHPVFHSEPASKAFQ